MESFLEAPVPFVVGTTRDPKQMEIPSDVVVLDATKDELVSSEPIAPLPKWDELYPFILCSFLSVILLFSFILTYK